jgi:hypothetical protein
MPQRPVPLPQHPDQHGPKRPILLAVDQQLGEGPRLRVPPELSDPVGALEVGEHEDVEQFGAGSGTEGVEARLESVLQFVRSHSRKSRMVAIGACHDAMIRGASDGRGDLVRGSYVNLKSGPSGSEGKTTNSCPTLRGAPTALITYGRTSRLVPGAAET